uniref:Endonuclease/exonuclease/phosphatase domain-containing protein n=1 Tax=Brassica oleracea var. oleracea TaxID=109376 RepID=A0A0D3ALV9_BRAOL
MTQPQLLLPQKKRSPLNRILRLVLNLHLLSHPLIIQQEKRIIQSQIPCLLMLSRSKSDGRIWVAWNPAINLTIHSKSSQMMTYLVQLPNSTDEVVVSYIYGLNCKYGRHHLWDEINCLARDPIIHGKPDCVEYSGLFDLSIRGSEFTWWNKQAASPIAKKLDRILINDLWQLKFPTSFAHFGSPDFSDHSPSCLILGDRWQEMHVIGSAMYSLSLKLKLLKKEIMDINREHFSDLEERVKEAHSHLVSYQNQLMADPTPLLASCEKEAHKKWDLFGAETQPLPLASLDQITELTSFRCSDSMKALLRAPVTAEDVKREIFSLPENFTRKLGM